MHAPLFSTVSLITELIISTAIFYTFYNGYKHNKFPTIVVILALAYEIIFNISYMANRTQTQVGKTAKGFELVLAISHGVLSLIMFVALLVFMMLAWSSYKKGHNYFKNHSILTGIFLFFWTLSVASGIMFYVLKYVL